ncbi:MAG: hypothetical protein ACD_16C00099G0035 [uncultured bacterium]|nr:MAG: hypothetical protein ACD_16C00099G0035 [uncultured bacterium]
MVVRPPETKSSKKFKFSPRLLLRQVANDNYPPKKYYLAWILIGVGLLFITLSLFLIG